MRWYSWDEFSVIELKKRGGEGDPGETSTGFLIDIIRHVIDGRPDERVYRIYK
jgi:hypothetical protein